MNTKPSPIRQTVLPLVAAFIWGSAFVAQYLGADRMPPFAFNTFRNLFAVPFLVALVFVFDAIRKKNPNFEPDYCHSNKEMVKGGILCGITLGIAMNFQQLGILSGAGKAGFLTAMYIVIIPIIGMVIGRRQPFKIWLSIFIAVIGLYLLCIKEDFSIEKTDIYLLLCALTYAVQMTFVDHYSLRVDAVRLSCCEFAVATILSAVFMLAFKQIPDAEMIKISMGPLLYTAILSSGVAYTLQIFSQKGTNISIVSLILCMESVFAALTGAIFLHEAMTAREYIGSLILLAAIVISQLPAKKEVKEQ
ncbi:MAG: DMT family transporter [Clostridia bacterium]|nr:DMT family transporter [Clostridia bacterium]